MGANRLEAFSDGVIAIIITIMVLELKVPHGSDLHALAELGPVAASYLLSFVVVAILWLNHHHLIHTVKSVDTPLLWLNSHLLFWMSLVPFVTGWLGEHHEAPLPAALYGVVMTGSSLSFRMLRAGVARRHGRSSEHAGVHARTQNKTLVATLLYAVSIPLAWVSPWLSIAIFAGVSVMYLVPTRSPAHT